MNMNEETAVGNAVIISIRDGDVVAKGRDERDVRVVGQARTTSENGNTVITADGSVVVEMPQSLRLEIVGEGVQDAALKRIGDVRLTTLHGSLAANDLKSLVAADIHGDASVRNVAGDVELADVHGDFAARAVRTVRVGAVHGHATVKDGESLRFEEVNGHLRTREIREVSGERVDGHAVVKDAEKVTVNHVNGHLSVKTARDVTVESVNGHVELKEVSGSVRLDNVDGNLELKGIGTSLAANEVQGDIFIRGAWQPGGEYVLNAQGTVVLNTEGAAHLIVKSEGKVEVGAGSEVQEDSDGTKHIYIGEREGAATVAIEAEGDVTINISDDEHYSRRQRHGDWNRHREFDWERHGPEVEHEMRRAMEEVRAEVHRAKHTVRHELEKAMREVEMHAQGPVGNVIRNAMQDLMNTLREKPGERGEEAVRESPVNEPSDEVRMILQMIADGKITPDQGEQLLQAMGEK